MGETQIHQALVPDLGGLERVDVVEVLVAVGDPVAADQGLIILESDKASLEVPSPVAGVIQEIAVAVGDKVAEHQLIAKIASDGEPAVEESDPATSPVESSVDLPTDPPHMSTHQLQDSPALRKRAEMLVLGGGPGGYTAAFRAADLGKRVTLVERYSELGGVCLNVGCIPSKALLHLAKVIEDAATASKQGVSFGEPTIDLEQINAWKKRIVDGLTAGLRTLAVQRGVEVVTGVGRFRSSHELGVAVTDSEPVLIEFQNAIVAAGSRIVELPGIPYGDPRVLDSTSALQLRTVPERLLVVGGGIIGLEMATVYHALGSKITVVELLKSLIPGCDTDIVRPLQQRLTKRYESVLLATRVSEVTAREDGLLVAFEGTSAPSPTLFDGVLVAVGRRANGDRIGAEDAGLKVDERGVLAVDRQMRTNVPHIFAIGDICGDPMLAHKAIYEGKIAAEVVAGEKSGFEAHVIPSVAYTDPEVAWVGVTEDEAKKQGLAYRVGTFPWSASGRAASMDRGEGRTKILFDAKTSRVIGGGIVGPHAGELIAELTLAIEMGCDALDLSLTIHPHPTLSETLPMSAEAFQGSLTDLYIPRKT